MKKLPYSEVAPKIEYSVLNEITNNFSEELGRGTFGKVFRGVQNGEDIAVKLLYATKEVDQYLEQFMKEFENLSRLRHPNIVQLLGYCYETKSESVEHEGRQISADNIYRALCFEYMHKGSLQNHLYDEFHGLDWQTRYKIIKGTCEGLKHLHEGLETPIYHLDLKPDNILLDKNMVPKLADFGLSRSVKTPTRPTGSSLGSMGYLPPEYIKEHLVSIKFDIFSLGVVMIRIMTGYKGYFKTAEMSSQEFIKLVHENWRDRLQATPGHTSLEDECHQVKRCIEIALDCVHVDRKKRPNIGVIIRWLNETEHMTEKLAMSLPHKRRHDIVSHVDKANSSVSNLVDEVQLMSVSAAPSLLQRITYVPKGPGETSTMIRSLGSTEISKLLDVHPLELRFPFKPNELVECPVTLTNRTDHYVGVWITPTDQDTCSDIHFPVPWEDPCSSLFQMMEPNSTWVIVMEMEEQREPPPRDTGKFEVLMIVMRSVECLRNLKSSIGIKLNMDSDFLKRVEELGSGEVHRAILTAVICDPSSYQAEIHEMKLIMPAMSEFEPPSMRYADTHPTETWILLSCYEGYIFIWNYQTQDLMMWLEGSTSNVTAICSAKFIVREKWLAIGDSYGWVHVYTYFTECKVKEFEVGTSVHYLTVHPTDPFLLTAAHEDTSIKLWDWSQDWTCTRTFDVANNDTWGGVVVRFTLNPRDTNTFCSLSFSGDVKVWDIHSSDPISTFTLELNRRGGPHYLYTDSHRHLVVTHEYRSNWLPIDDRVTTNMYANIWDLQTGERVHRLGLSVCWDIDRIACHPMLPILATMQSHTSNEDTIVCLWDARTYRLEKMVRLAGGAEDIVFITGTKDLTRLAAICWNRISIIEFNLPTVRTDIQTDGGN